MLLFPLYLTRLFWFASVLSCFMSLPDRQSNLPNLPTYRLFPLHLFLTSLLIPFYWPELLPNWSTYFLPLIILIMLTRTAMTIEALHFQTTIPSRTFPYWSRLVAGVFLVSAVPIILIWAVKDGTPSQLLVQYRRYLQIWTALVICTAELLLWAVGWLSWKTIKVIEEDRHALLIMGIGINHGLVSILSLVNHLGWSEDRWAAVNLSSTLIDSFFFILWGVWCCGSRRTSQSARLRFLSLPASVPPRT